MNGEIAQVGNIVLASKSALKKRILFFKALLLASTILPTCAISPFIEIISYFFNIK